MHEAVAARQTGLGLILSVEHGQIGLTVGSCRIGATKEAAKTMMPFLVLTNEWDGIHVLPR